MWIREVKQPHRCSLPHVTYYSAQLPGSIWRCVECNKHFILCRRFLWWGRKWVRCIERNE